MRPAERVGRPRDGGWVGTRRRTWSSVRCGAPRCQGEGASTVMTAQRLRAGHDRHALAHVVGLRGDDARAAAEALDVDAVGGLPHVGHVVADEDHRQAAVAQLLDHVEDHPRLLDTQGSGRLVEDDDLAPERRGARHRDRLALATGERLDGLTHVLDRLDAELLHRVAGPLLHALLVEHPQHRPERSRAALLASEVEVARDVERRDDGQLLVDRLDAGLAGVLRTLEAHRLARRGRPRPESCW